jgi:hypothetical protein
MNLNCSGTRLLCNQRTHLDLQEEGKICFTLREVEVTIICLHEKDIKEENN